MSELMEMAVRAKAAKRSMSTTPAALRVNGLLAVADALEQNIDDIITANQLDIENGRKAGLSEALLDRLLLDEKRIAAIAQSVRDIAGLPDPLGRILDGFERPNGLKIFKVSVPLGVIAVIYEARPNVTVDSAALCLKSGNVVILRGGKEAINSNTALTKVMRAAVAARGLPADCIQLVQDTSRESANELMCLTGYVDVLIPRGGRGLIQNVVKNARVPVIETGAGTCHVYVDKAADLHMASEIIFNAKTSRPSVCNACECILVHNKIAETALPLIKSRLDEKNVELRGDEKACAILPGITKATDEDWGKEFSDYILAVRVVNDLYEATEHIFRYGTAHSECIVTEDDVAAQRFLNQVDAAAVYHNASTRFTDGGEFGFGAEIGISTQKLHARGPLGLNELTSIKYIIHGTGQVR